jgi:1,2-diacylglycerol 3-beta-galactosyltransferase
MTPTQKDALQLSPRRVVFLMSDSGGGHRAAAEAIRAAMQIRYPGAYVFELVDVYRRYTPFPFSYMPEIYAHWVRSANALWGLGFRLTDDRFRAAMLAAVLDRLWRRRLRRLPLEHPAHVVVSVHSMFSRPALRTLARSPRRRPPFVSVLTDLVSAHAIAYAREVDRCLTPTPAAYARGLRLGLRPQQLRVTGLPVHPQFVEDLPARDVARARLDLRANCPCVVVAGGADGVGQVEAIACELNRRKLAISLVIIAGRNQGLLRRLQARDWNQPTRIYAFVDNMPEWLAAADILVTKAGPATISEACIAGVPLVLSGHVFGQEDGNIAHVVEHGAGVYAPVPGQAADTVAAWLSEGSDRLAARGRAAHALARPDAVWDIAEEIHVQAQRGSLQTHPALRAVRRQPRLSYAPEDNWVL